MNLNDIKKETVTIGDLLEFTKWYDGCGDMKYQENEFEGKEFIMELIENRCSPIGDSRKQVEKELGY